MQRATRRRQRGKTELAPERSGRSQQTTPPNQELKLTTREAHSAAVQCLHAGQPARAVKLYRQILEHEPNNADAHNNLGCALYQLAQPGDAVVSFRLALAIKNDYAEAQMNLGSALFQFGELEEALTPFCSVLAIDPDDSRARSHLGRLFLFMGDFQE